MNAIQMQMVRQSFAYFRPCGRAMVASVVRNVTDHHPGLRALLPADTSPHHRAWFETLGQIVKHGDRFHVLEAPLARLGAETARAGLNAGHLRILRNELLEAMEDLSGEDWTPDLRRAWSTLLDAATGAMLAGAMDHRRAA
jgi:hemoglobin-like flavoprotein